MAVIRYFHDLNNKLEVRNALLLYNFETILKTVNTLYAYKMSMIYSKSTLGVVNGLYKPHQSILSVAMRNSTVNFAGEHH